MGFLVTPAPHKYAKQDTNNIYMIVVFALLPLILLAIVNYKMPAIIVVLTSIATCLVTEFICASIKNKKFMFTDCSFIVTSFVLACIMPINAPWYLVLVAGVLAIVSKYIFGGLGNNLFNPAGLARATLGVMFADFSTLYITDAKTPLFEVLAGNNANLSLEDLFLGNTAGALGTTAILLIIVAAVVLMVLKIIRWESVICALCGFSIIVGVCSNWSNILPMALSGSFLFVVVYMLSDPTTSSYSFSARAIDALIFGVLAATFMTQNILGESAVFLALLISNFIAPALDTLFSVFHRGVKIHD
jgi:Na+-translocating ferredoxin:NAD+ oxidoreductase RnfD subunit